LQKKKNNIAKQIELHTTAMLCLPRGFLVPLAASAAFFLLPQQYPSLPASGTLAPQPAPQQAVARKLGRSRRRKHAGASIKKTENVEEAYQRALANLRNSRKSLVAKEALLVGLLKTVRERRESLPAELPGKVRAPGKRADLDSHETASALIATETKGEA
jgi:hypothetical protein